MALAVAEATIEYARRQLTDGLTPEQARRAALDPAGALADLAEGLRRLTRIPAPHLTIEEGTTQP